MMSSVLSRPRVRASRHLVATGALLLALTATTLGVAPTARADEPAQAAAAAVNPIIEENKQPGTRDWKLRRTADDIAKQVKGYANATSVNRGASIDLKLHVNRAQKVDLEVFRLGWYGGAGARLVTTVRGLNASPQAACPVDPTTFLIQCSWATLTRLTVPTSWVSGQYLVRMTNTDGFDNYIPFVVRDDTSRSELLVQSAVMTMQAYNKYPADGTRIVTENGVDKEVSSCGAKAKTGKNLYDGQSAPGASPITNTDRAVAVSFDRPYECTGAGNIVDNNWSWDHYFIQWLEKNGHDVSYATNLDTHLRPQLMRNHKGWVSIGHDEYWTKQMFDAAEQTRNAGVNLAFFGANDVYWQVRMEDRGGLPARTMVAYKNTPNGTFETKDPIADPRLRTVRFEDPPVNRPAQSLMGVSFFGSVGSPSKNNDLVVSTGGWPFNTAGVASGTRFRRLNGYEVDRYSCMYAPPANTGMSLLTDSPFVDMEGPVSTSQGAAYTAPSGALVFSAGTMSWVWGIVDKQDPQNPSINLYDPKADAVTRVIVDTLAGRRAKPALPAFTPRCTDTVTMNFERGAVTGTDGIEFVQPQRDSTIRLTTTNPIQGAASLLFSTERHFAEERITPNKAVNIEAKVRVEQAPTAPVTLIMARSGPLNQASVMVIPVQGGYVLRAQYAGRTLTESPVLAYGTTYTHKLRQTVGTGSNGTAQFWVAPAGALPGQPYASVTSLAAQRMTDRVLIGSISSPAIQAAVDQVVITTRPS